jgi:hypothetical protein
MADPQHASQLVRGFHGIEGPWRWTQKSFAVRLVAPAGAAQKGAVLQLRFAIPDVVMQNVKSVTLSAAVNGSTLSPETYKKSGSYIYTRPVRAEQIQTSPVSVEFTLDHTLPPTSADRRELGVVVTEVGLTVSE